jgi:hypothetical protein
VGFSPKSLRDLRPPNVDGRITPAAKASSTLLRNLRRRIKERRITPQEIRRRRNRVARNVNL